MKLPKHWTDVVVDIEQEKQRINNAFYDTMIFGKGAMKIENYKLDDIATCQNPWPAQKNITAAEIAHQMEGMWEWMRPGMQKRHFEKFAEACQAIEQGIIDLHIPMPEHYREQVMELVVARVALVCAEDNKNFDSFQFAGAARKNARRGIKETRAVRVLSTAAKLRSQP
jgi:hypothetical protein